ncbi:MAG TPA: hypothetical protein ENI23_16855 [bacterium]|nr:hypothetical protein [bacterium]
MFSSTTKKALPSILIALVISAFMGWHAYLYFQIILKDPFQSFGVAFIIEVVLVTVVVMASISGLGKHQANLIRFSFAVLGVMAPMMGSYTIYEKETKTEVVLVAPARPLKPSSIVVLEEQLKDVDISIAGSKEDKVNYLSKDPPWYNNANRVQGLIDEAIKSKLFIRNQIIALKTPYDKKVAEWRDSIVEHEKETGVSDQDTFSGRVRLIFFLFLFVLLQYANVFYTTCAAQVIRFGKVNSDLSEKDWSSIKEPVEPFEITKEDEERIEAVTNPIPFQVIESEEVIPDVPSPEDAAYLSQESVDKMMGENPKFLSSINRFDPNQPKSRDPTKSPSEFLREFSTAAINFKLIDKFLDTNEYKSVYDLIYMFENIDVKRLVNRQFTPGIAKSFYAMLLEAKPQLIHRWGEKV